MEDGKGIATCMIPGNSYFKNDPVLCALRVKQNAPRFEARISLQNIFCNGYCVIHTSSDGMQGLKVKYILYGTVTLFPIPLHV